MNTKRLKVIFGQELRKARKAVGISQEKLALLVGLDRTYISMLERGIRQPSLTTIFLICPEIKITSAELVARVEERME